MRILVIGPGALGIVTAVRLHQAGHEVEVAVRSAAKAKQLNASGLRLTDTKDNVHRAHLPCVHNPKKCGPYDVIFSTTKCQVAESVAKQWLPTLADDGVFVPFQNGVEGDALQAVVGDRLVECSVYWPATLVEPGHSHHTGAGMFVVGPWPRGTVEPRHEELASILRAVAPTQTSDRMDGVKWSKLAINAAMTSCGVVSGKTLGEMVRHRPSAEAFLGIIRETVAVMDGLQIPVVRVGPSKPDLLAKLPGPLARPVLRAIAKRYGKARSSSAQSIARGEPTEVDYLNGRIAREGARVGVATPINAAVVETVHAIERGAQEQGLDSVARMMASLR